MIRLDDRIISIILIDWLIINWFVDWKIGELRDKYRQTEINTDGLRLDWRRGMDIENQTDKWTPIQAERSTDIKFGDGDGPNLCRVKKSRC